MALRAFTKAEKKVSWYWNFVVPAYTLFHEDDKTFSDVWSDYNEDFNTFYSNVVNDLNTYKDVKGIKAKPNQPKNFCSVSSIPWLSFSSFAQDTYEESDLYYSYERDGKTGRHLSFITQV